MRMRAIAPGRVNLIGDHTDYQDGWCLPLAIDREVSVTFNARTDDQVRATTAAAFDADWTRIVDAVIHVLGDRGRAPVGFDAHVESTVPVGSGLSSSAALEVALAVAAARVADFPLDGVDLARAAQAAEHLASGVPCGVMDQMASVFGVANHALLLDCRSLAVQRIPIPDDARITVVHSGLPRALASSAYAERRAACEAAAARLGVPTLRDAELDDVRDDPLARHVVSENVRTRQCADALRAGDLETVGSLMLASHVSLRDDFAVSTPELNRLVELAYEAGALGARLTGAGFGGCIVALSRAPLDASLAERYRAATALEPTVFEVRASDGAHVSEE
jgi:galactokinase